jgi:hypothetical protein
MDPAAYFSPSWSWSYSSSYCVTQCIHYYYQASYFSWVSRGRVVDLIVLHLYSLLLPCFILQLDPSWSWSYGSSYCATLVFTTITILHTSVRRGRDCMVVLIVLHLYSLLLPCFILQLDTSWSWSYGISYCVTLVFTTITILHTSVRRGGDRIVVLIVLHLYSLILPCLILQSIMVVIVW